MERFIPALTLPFSLLPAAEHNSP